MNTLDTTHPAGPVADRVAANDWTALTDELNEHGHALTTRLLTPDECHGIKALYDEADRFAPPSTWPATARFRPVPLLHP